MALFDGDGGGGADGDEKSAGDIATTLQSLSGVRRRSDVGVTRSSS